MLNIGKGELRKTKINVLPFSQEHLETMFSSYIYSDNRISREKPNAFHYWLPLIGLWTGARLNEIATLLISDIIEIEGILCFDINEEGDKKSVKNETSKRIIPIASAILDAGFESYIDQRKRAKTKKGKPIPLFDLPEHRDGVSRAVSKWFNENFKVKCNLSTPKNSKVVFHSFRHTFINTMQSTRMGNDLVPNRIIQEIVGHETGVVTNDVYGENHDYQILKDVIDSLDFNFDFGELTFARFQRRR